MKKLLTLSVLALTLTACGETSYSLYNRGSGLSISLRGQQERAATIMTESYRRECKGFVVDDAPRHQAALNALRVAEGEAAIENRIEFVRGNLVRNDPTMCSRNRRVSIV